MGSLVISTRTYRKTEIIVSHIIVFNWKGRNTTKIHLGSQLILVQNQVKT